LAQVWEVIFAFHLGTHFKTNLLLLNPALHGRSFDPPIIKDGAEESRIWALVGKMIRLSILLKTHKF
jgi:hypothetical protein